MSIVAATWHFVFYKSAHEDFDCISNHRLNHGNITIRATYIFQFKKNNGSVKINGMILKDNSPLTDINRVVTFSFRSSGNGQYLLTSETIKKLSLTGEAEALLAMHFPLFYIKEGAKLSLAITEEKGDYVIVMGGVPAFYCDRI